jgi:hypothetical protein
MLPFRDSNTTPLLAFSFLPSCQYRHLPTIRDGAFGPQVKLQLRLQCNLNAPDNLALFAGVALSVAIVVGLVELAVL